MKQYESDPGRFAYRHTAGKLGRFPEECIYLRSAGFQPANGGKLGRCPAERTCPS